MLKIASSHFIFKCSVIYFRQRIFLHFPPPPKFCCMPRIANSHVCHYQKLCYLPKIENSIILFSKFCYLLKIASSSMLFSNALLSTEDSNFSFFHGYSQCSIRPNIYCSEFSYAVCKILLSTEDSDSEVMLFSKFCNLLFPHVIFECSAIYRRQ